eukprot:403339009
MYSSQNYTPQQHFANTSQLYEYTQSQSAFKQRHLTSPALHQTISDQQLINQKLHLTEKFDSLLKTQIQNKNKLLLEQALAYEDGRSHYIFNDQTAIILHPKGDCFTYFSREGKKSRQLVKYAVSSSVRELENSSVVKGFTIQDKLVLAVQFHNTYCDEPIMSRVEFTQTKEDEKVVELYERQSKFQKVTQVTWPGFDNWDEYITQDDQGNITLRSIEQGVAEITLSANSFHLSISYQYMLPFKKPTWTQVTPDFDESAIKSVIRDFSSKPDTKRMKMLYEYVKVKQFFSILRFPSRWCYPVSLLMQYKENIKLRDNTDYGFILAPVYCNNFHASIEKCCYQELVRNKEFTTELPMPTKIQMEKEGQDNQSSIDQSHFTSQMSQKSMRGMADQQSTLSINTSSIIGQNSRYDTDKSIQNLIGKNNTITVWTDDDISPASFLHSHKTNILLQWNSLCTSRTVLIPPLRSFTCDTVPFSVADSIDPANKPRIQFHEILVDAFIIIKHPFVPCELYSQEGAYEDDKLSKESLLAAQQNLVVKEMRVEGLAHFIAYSNKSIKVQFDDRTILRMQLNSNILRILSKSGQEVTLNLSKPNILFNDYRNYIKVADEFYEWCFTTQEQRAVKDAEEQRQREIIQYEMDKIQRTLCFLDSNSFQPQVSYDEEQIERECQEQSEQLQKDQLEYQIALETPGYGSLSRGEALKEIECNASKINEIQELLEKLKK